MRAALWDDEIMKMIKAYGAPIDGADAKAIADYLKEELRYLIGASCRMALKE